MNQLLPNVTCHDNEIAGRNPCLRNQTLLRKLAEIEQSGKQNLRSTMNKCRMTPTLSLQLQLSGSMYIWL